MPRTAGLLILATMVALLAGCPGMVKPDLPTATVVKPSIVYVDRYIYVPIKKELTRKQPIAEGPLSECPLVARDRKASIQKGNAQLDAIDAIQGTPVKP